MASANYLTRFLKSGKPRKAGRSGHWKWPESRADQGAWKPQAAGET
jgi:hypothetical protein